MKRRILVAAVWFPMIFFVVATTSNAQTTQTAPIPQPTPINLDVMYTGKLLGYFRVPSLQKIENFKGCYPTSDSDSRAAREFLAKRREHTAAILVGTGDNFSPQLEARIFSDPPNQGTKYAVGNKELYFGNNMGWIFYDQLNRDQRKRIRDGLGTIPSDNVGCFLRAANFTAIVPGKHDFYFGAERVRQFARLLAEPKAGNFKPVQMLGANLVIKTVPIESKPVSAKIPDDWHFKEWPENLSVQNLKDGKVVYPWFSYVKIKLIELQANEQFTSDLNQHFSNAGGAALNAFVDYVGKYPSPKTPEEIKELNQLHSNALQSKSIDVCRSSGGPNEINAANCDPLERLVSWTGTTFTLSLTLPEKYLGQGGHFSTLEFGQNYGLCVDVPLDPKSSNKSTRGCMRFAAHTPFFSFPHRAPGEKDDGYTDPDPYVIDRDVAIFGVVDPNLNEQVGILNLGWQNEQSNLTTRLSVEDPAEALRQQLDYFERRTPGGFKGLKVLLAQTTPQRAKALAAKFPEFQIVVSAADLEQGTSESEMWTVWKPGARTGSFLAVPTPYFDTTTREGSVHFGIVKAARRQDQPGWKLTSANLGVTPVPEYGDPATKFWARIKTLPKVFASHVQNSAR